MQHSQTSFSISGYKALSILLGLSLIAAHPAATHAQRPDRDAAAWVAVVSDDSLAVFSQMSSESRIVKHLKRGDRVVIELEIISSGETWCSVIEAGQKKRSGYVRGEGLDKEGSASVTRWRAKPDVNTADRDAKTGAAQDRALKDAIEEGVAKALAARLDRLPPVNPPGQSSRSIPDDSKATHDHHYHHYGFDDRTLIVLFPGFGLPRKTFRHAPPVKSHGSHVRMTGPFIRK